MEGRGRGVGRQRQLIVMADDYGIGPETSRGILDLAARGVVTGSVLLVTSPYAEADVAAWRRAGCRPQLGWHPCLTLDAPILPPERVPSLVGPDGRFLRLGRLVKRLLCCGMQPGEVEAEFHAQLRRFRDLVGSPPTLVNSHHHVQVFSPIGAILEQVLATVRPLPYVRRIHEPWRLLAAVPGARVKRAVLSLLGRGGARRQAVAGFPGADWHVGITDPPHVADPDFFARWLRRTPGQVVELCCHPGFFDATLAGRDCTPGDGHQLRRVREHALLRQAGLQGSVRTGRFRADRYLRSAPRRSQPCCLRPGGPRTAGSAVAVVAWVLTLAVLGGNAFLRPTTHTVYPVFANAGRHWLGTQGLYDSPGPGPYRYSPLAAAGFVPFAVLPAGPAGLLWRWLGAAVFLIGLEWVVKTLWATGFTREQRGLVFLLALPLAVGNIHNGQANLLVLGLVLIAVAAVTDGRWNIAAACLAIACLFKLYPIAVGLLLVALFRAASARGSRVALAAGFLLPFLLQRPGYVADQYAAWVRSLAEDDRQHGSYLFWYRDLRLLFSQWIAPIGYRTYLILQICAGGAIAAVCFWARRAGIGQARLLTLVLGLGCCWMTALGPASESATYSLLGPTAAWLVVSGMGESGGGLRIVGLVGLRILLLSLVAATLPAGWGRQVHALGPQPLAALFVLVGLLCRCLKIEVRAKSQRSRPSLLPMRRKTAESC